ncbi:MAG TPA: efflux transporter outer membrane subunit [Burkholderiales bacterium]|nr:efflux transporter outer membrane subunit [Burkholderiales bacterium]
MNRIFLILIVLLIAGCASSDGLVKRSKPADALQLKAAESLAAVPVAPGAWPSEEWWKSLADPQLDALIAEALAASPTMRLARSRVDRAVALAEAAGAALAPQASAQAGASRQRISENSIYPRPLAGSWIWQNQALLNFSYDFDFWGRNAAAHAAALGQAKAAEADAHAARLMLSSAVALAYVQMARTFDQLDLARELLAQREHQLKLVHTRLLAGLDSRVELRQAQGTPPETRQRIAQLEESIELSRHQIAALLGQGPDRGLAIERPRPGAGAAFALPSQLPVDLLGRRPDIVASRWRVEAAERDADRARAEFYPNLNLIAFAGLQAITWSKFVETGSRALGAGPALSLPIFDGGQLRGNLGTKNADYDAAAEQYNQALAEALRDVADQVAAWRSIERQEAEVAASLAAAQSAYDLALARYRAGLSSYLTVIGAETQLTAQRGLVAELRARRLEAAIGLARALGGGYGGKT